MAGTYLGDNDWVVSDENGEPMETNDGEGTGSGPDEIDSVIVDTDSDSWDSGSNEPDAIDSIEYDGEASRELVEDGSDESDKDDLGNEADGEPDPDETVLSDIEPLDDEEIDDRTFDCD